MKEVQYRDYNKLNIYFCVSVTVNQIMIVTVKLLKWWLQINH